MSNNGYQPYMFGGSYGQTGTPQPAGNTTNPMMNTYAGQASRRDPYNVRDCMFWPASIQASNRQQSQRANPVSAACVGHSSAAPQAFSSNRGDQVFSQTSSMGGGMGSSDPYVFHAGYAPSATGEPMQQAQVQYPLGHVKAYISTPAEDGGPSQPIQIPCHLGGPGQVPMVPPQAPLGYRITVPATVPTPPVDFEIKQ